MYQKNQTVTVSIEDIGIDGAGIGKAEGFPLFIKDAIVGDTVEVRITKVKKTYGYARVERVLVPSPFRVKAPCANARRCGGCQIMEMSYEKQLEFKSKKVFNNLVRIGGIDESYLSEIFEPIIGMEGEPLRYRNKAQYPFGRDKDGRIVTGFYAGRTHSIINNTDCLLGVEENKDVLEIVLDYMNRYGIEPYNEETGAGLIRHVLIRKGFTGGELMVCLVINGDELPRKQKLIDELIKLEGMKSISISINKARSNVIMGDNYHVLWGNEKINDTMHRPDGSSVSFVISPLSFYQVNPVQTERLYGTALEYAALTGTENVWDLYCGIGTISLFMAKNAGMVYGVEIIPQAIDDANENARINGIRNVKFFVGEAEKVLPDFYEAANSEGSSLDDAKMQSPDVICIDPPRKGCDEACLETMVKMGPNRIVYVSCDSATLARDVKYLTEHGYELKRVRPVDMFGNSVHVESVCLLSKVNTRD